MMYIIFVIVLFTSMLVYFRVANRFNIIDKPNARSSHTEITIRGGGIIYLVASILAVIMHPQYLLPMLSIVMIGVVSFIDDRITLSNKIRFLVHLGCVSILFYYLGLFTTIPFWWVFVSYILVVGTINAYNFMDGINGITGGYTTVVLLGLQYVNYSRIKFVEYDLIWLPIIASLVFLFFNFRKKAKCFAGDVGSISIALWIVFLLCTLIIETEDFSYILFLTVYGVDSVLTIVHRLILKQNIFDAHRLHFYQILANEAGISHLIVASIYSIIQLLVISLVLFSQVNEVVLASLSIIPLAILYAALKPLLMRRSLKIN